RASCQTKPQLLQFTVSGQRVDLPIETVAAILNGDDSLVTGVERGLQASQLETLLTQLVVMNRFPRRLTWVADSAAQQQLPEAVPGAHQIAPAALTSTHQITSRLLALAGDHHAHDLTQPQQLGDRQRIASVGLDALTHRALQLRWRQHLATYSS